MPRDTHTSVHSIVLHDLPTEPHAAESRRGCRPVVSGASDHVHTHVQRAAHRDEAQAPASQVLLPFITAFILQATINFQYILQNIYIYAYNIYEDI